MLFRSSDDVKTNSKNSELPNELSLFDDSGDMITPPRKQVPEIKSIDTKAPLVKDAEKPSIKTVDSVPAIGGAKPIGALAIGNQNSAPIKPIASNPHIWKENPSNLDKPLPIAIPAANSIQKPKPVIIEAKQEVVTPSSIGTQFIDDLSDDVFSQMSDLEKQT